MLPLTPFLLGTGTGTGTGIVAVVVLLSSISGDSKGFVCSANDSPIDREHGPGADIVTHTGSHGDDDSILFILSFSVLSAALLRNWVRNAY